MSATTTEHVKEAYDSWHSRIEVDEKVDAPWHLFLQHYLKPENIAGVRLLEIGCGRGGFSCWLATNPAPPSELIAADFSSAAVEKGGSFAREKGIHNITWKVADIQDLPFPENYFETVISCETIEHVPSPFQAIGELARVLKPGGKLFLTTPSYLGTLGLYRLYLRMRGRTFQEEGQPINHFTWLPQTCRWVTKQGLTIEVADSIGHYLPFPGRPPIRLKWLDRFRFPLKWFGMHSLIVARKDSKK